MAVLSLESLRNLIRTQIYGRRFGLDNTLDQIIPVGGVLARGGMLVGAMGMRFPIQLITATGGSSIYPAGYVELSCTTGSSAINSIQAPIPGLEVTIFNSATSTLGHVVQSSGANFQTSAGSSQNQFVLLGQGNGVCLIGVSTAKWQCEIIGATAGVTLSTF